MALFHWIDIGWETMFVPTVSLLEIMLRGTITYWFCFAYIRFFKRGAGQVGIGDLLLITLISSATQNSMSGGYKSVIEGFVLVGTLNFWDYFIGYLGFQSVLFRKILASDPVLLVRDGVMQRQNMKKELISTDELMGLLREHGVHTLADVRTCLIESDGKLSVSKIDKK